MNTRAPKAQLLGAALLLGATATSPAHASLTSSEKGLIREYVAAAKVDTAQKVRSLVARTDLTPDESAGALTEAMSPVPFTDARAAFLWELTFGAASAPSRPVLTLATVRALLARADTIYQRFVGGLDHEPAAISELVAIYGWLDSVIANAGKPTSTAHDPSAGIPAATYEECSKALRDHVEQNARWLKGDGAIPGAAVRVRAQAQVALVDMLPDGLTRRVLAADRLGLKSARRALLSDYGVLLEDSGKIDDAGAERVRQLIAKMPGVQSELGLLCLEERGPKGTSGPPLRARGQVVHVAPGPEPYPFDDPAPASYDPTTGAVAHELGVVLAMRVLESRGAPLRLQSERDLAAANGDRSRLLGRPRGPSVEYVVGAAIHALLVDASKSVELAGARGQAGHLESAALLSDALGVLAAPPASAGQKAAPATHVELGKPGGFVSATNLRVAPNGTVLGLRLDPTTWVIERAPTTYIVLGLHREGQKL
jgi:hypothetical protein